MPVAAMLRPSKRAYPLSWRLLDAAEAAVGLIRPKRPELVVPALFLAPAILLVAVLVWGLVDMASDSLHMLDTATFLPAEAMSLGNYAQLIDRPIYATVIWRSLLAGVIVTVATLLLAFPYAYVMVRTPSPVIRRVLLISLFLPFFIGQVVRAYGWLIILGAKGIVNGAITGLGFEPLKLIYTYETILFGLVQYMLPFAVLLIAPAITAIGEEVEMAASSLGANWWRGFATVVLPMARPGLIAAGVVVFTLTLTDFAIPNILGGGTNDFAANAIYDAFFRISDSGLGAALAIVLTFLGSTIVGIILAIAGAGTLGMGGRAPAKGGGA
jgi:putative spermidine/putrescine transport system permease protein